MSPPKAVEVDPRGDVKLRVGGGLGADSVDPDPVVFVACSRALAHASPVFDRMLYGDFAEAKHGPAAAATEEWIVDLASDKPGPMQIFLDIMHGHFHAVPRALSVEALYDLTVLTNFYDATWLLTPWAKEWMVAIDDIINDANIVIPKILWVSWELGRKDTFATVSRRMMMESGGSDLDSTQFQDIQTPPDIIERIDAIRIQTVQGCMNIFQEMVDNLIVVDERARWCRHHEWMGPHRCESMILGSMTFCLARAGLWPVLQARDIDYSVLDLYGKLTSLVIHDIGLVEQGDRPVVDHGVCNPRKHLFDLVQCVVREMPSPLTDAHVKHLEEQAKRLAL